MDCSIRQSFPNSANEIFCLASSIEPTDPQNNRLTAKGAKAIVAFAFDHFAKGTVFLKKIVGGRKLLIADSVCYIKLNSKELKKEIETEYTDSNVRLILKKDGTVSEIRRKVHHPKSKPEADLINQSELPIPSTYSPPPSIDIPVNKILSLAPEETLTREAASEIVKYAFGHFERDIESQEKILYGHEVTIIPEGCFINLKSKKSKVTSYNQNDVIREISNQNNGLLLSKDGTVSIYMRKKVLFLNKYIPSKPSPLALTYNE